MISPTAGIVFEVGNQMLAAVLASTTGSRAGTLLRAVCSVMVHRKFGTKRIKRVDNERSDCPA